MRALGRFLIIFGTISATLWANTLLGQGNPVDYPMSDYKDYGMLFMARHRSTVEDLTSKLVKQERDSGYFGGDRQEDIIRSKVKKYVAIASGVYPGKGGETDDQTHRAVKSTNDYFRLWESQMPEIKNKEAAKALAEKHYNAALEQESERSRGEALKKAERIQKSREEAIMRSKEKDEWEKRNDLARLKKEEEEAKKVRKETCKQMCLVSHRSALMYFRCMEACKKY